MTLRLARHTNNLETLKLFYCNVLGLGILSGFENHDGYDGVFIGKPSENWHLEFTQSEEVVSFNFGEDDILVFYPDNKMEYEMIMQNLELHHIKIVQAKNSYWNENGIMITDPDGYRIIISHLKIIK